MADDECHMRIGGFGLAVLDEAATDDLTGRGTPRWISPERTMGQRGRPTRADDVYGFACICYSVRLDSPIQLRER
jgi:serine/threonine protein kinase